MKFWRLVLAMAVMAALAHAADVTGNWKSKMETPRGTFERTFVFKQDGDKLSGKIVSQRGEVEIKEGKATDDGIEFTVEQPGAGGETRKVTYKGKVSGDEIKGTFSGGQGGQEREWSATKEK